MKYLYYIMYELYIIYNLYLMGVLYILLGDLFSFCLIFFCFGEYYIKIYWIRVCKYFIDFFLVCV